MTPGILSLCSNYPTKIISKLSVFFYKGDFSVFFNPNGIFLVFLDGDLILPKNISLSHLPSWRSSSLPSSMAYNRGARGFSSEDFTAKRVVSVGFQSRVSFLGFRVGLKLTHNFCRFLFVTTILGWWLICSGKILNGIEETCLPKYIPRIPRGRNKYDGYTYVRGTPVLVPWLKHLPQQILGCDQPKPDILRRFCLEMHCGLEKRYRKWKGAL